MIRTDACNQDLGAVLFQKGRTVVSHTLTPTEAKYSQIELKFLVMVFAIVCFKVCLLGRHFTLKMDHLPVLGLCHKAIDLIIQLQHYDFALVHIKGRCDLSAGAVSRNSAGLAFLYAETAEYMIDLLTARYAN